MYDKIIKKCMENNVLSMDLDLINKAYNDYGKASDHAIRVSYIVSELNADVSMIIASLLHDAAEKEEIKVEEIEEIYGRQISDIVYNLIKLNKLKLTNYNESSSIYLRKVLVGISEDVRVLIIKLADRLDEMRNNDLDSEEKKRMASETESVLIPIAHRLGINSIKSELEDLCLKFSKPDVYNEILEKLSGTREELADSLEDMQNNIINILTEHGISFHIKSRVKSVYSIYNKLATGRKWSDIYDILAMRLIVPTKEDCYLAVGLIHAKFRPIPKRFKDYIAVPKENMYQSLHTSIFGTDGHIFEVQLRTKEMDEIAEHGIASHWSYKEHGTKKTQNIMEQKLEIFRNAIDIAKKEESDEAFVSSMKEELLTKLIYVFTPKGDVLELPLGATPIDFAYRIHSDVGDKMVSAIVNDSIVPLDYELNDGDIVKINTNPNGKPNKEWLNYAKTTQAKSKIKSYFSKEFRDKYFDLGKDLLDKEVRKSHLASDILKDDNLNKILKALKLRDIDDLYISVGSLRYTPNYVLSIITEEKKKVEDLMLERVNKPHLKASYDSGVIVSNVDNIKTAIAKCCSPIPGDDIIGYITKGEGVIVHKKSCPNIKGIKDRLIDVSWGLDNNKLFDIALTIKTNTNQNKLLDIVTKASARSIQITKMEEKYASDNIIYLISIKINNLDSLNVFISDLKSLTYVVEVTR